MRWIQIQASPGMRVWLILEEAQAVALVTVAPLVTKEGKVENLSLVLY